MYTHLAQVVHHSPALAIHTGSAGSAAQALHKFNFMMVKTTATVILKLSAPAGTELAQAVLDIQALRDGTFAMWALASDGGVQAVRWKPADGMWQVRLVAHPMPCIVQAASSVALYRDCDTTSQLSWHRAHDMWCLIACLQSVNAASSETLHLLSAGGATSGAAEQQPSHACAPCATARVEADTGCCCIRAAGRAA